MAKIIFALYSEVNVTCYFEIFDAFVLPTDLPAVPNQAKLRWTLTHAETGSPFLGITCQIV